MPKRDLYLRLFEGQPNEEDGLIDERKDGPSLGLSSSDLGVTFDDLR